MWATQYTFILRLQRKRVRGCKRHTENFDRDRADCTTIQIDLK